MKVLSAPVVSKTLTEGSMDCFIVSPSIGDMKSGSPLPEQSCETNATKHHPTENINQKRWKSLFRRVKRGSIQSSSAVQLPERPLFGQLLSDVCDDNGTFPKPITEILTLLLRKGPYTEGVFRKAGNAKRLREIKEQLNNRMDVDLKDEPVILLAALLKVFLRHLPDSLLVVEQYQAWMTALEKTDIHETCTELKLVVDKLPEQNILLLRHLIVVLYHISKNAGMNKMDSRNLAVCVSPNLLQVDNVEMVEKVSALTQFLIDNCCEIFGESILTLLGNSDDEDLSDNQDSPSSHHHDSAYDSNDPDADGDNGSYTDLQPVRSTDGRQDWYPISPRPTSTSEEKLIAASLCTANKTLNTCATPFLRRSSEPTIILSQGTKTRLTLSRTHTDFLVETRTDIKCKALRKQISDECILLGDPLRNRLMPSQRLSCGLLLGEPNFPTPSKDCSCSNCSLESAFSSTSESSLFTGSPTVSPSSQRRTLQRKQSFPTRPTAQGHDATKKRSQSLRSMATHNRTSFSRGNANRLAAEKALGLDKTRSVGSRFDRQSNNPLHRPRRLSSMEVFQRVDSLIPSQPPSYEWAIQSDSPPHLLQCRSMTVHDARCLSMHRSPEPTSITEKLSHSYLVNACADSHCCQGCEKSYMSSMAVSSQVVKQRSISESEYKAPFERLKRRYSQPLFKDMSYVRESYV